jgi:4-amino-4-deoxy-L-arabinose transferase-like glycosyltransferase
VLVAATVYLGTVVSPPSLMDDVDAVQAQIARNMLVSGDWVTAHLDGVKYLEKAPAIYWSIATSYRIFGVHDWAARIPVALAVLALCGFTTAFGIWAFGKPPGFYAGLCMSTCVGLFLFTRILIPDVMLTLAIGLAMWSFLRCIDETEPHPEFWSIMLAVCLGAGLLLKSLIGIVFPIAAGTIYLFLTRKQYPQATWKRLHPIRGLVIVLTIAVPWHVLAAIRNPPYFAFTLHSGPGSYHGFLWFFFINEQLLRFLNMRYPRDYDTVPRLIFWLGHLLWLFPWSVYLPSIAGLSFKPIDRAGRTRLLALCWIGFILVFFTFSTTQEYYSMPSYPAFALLIGCGMAAGGKWIRRGNYLLAGSAAVVMLVTGSLYFATRHLSAPGDIARALSERPGTYLLSLDHMKDLTFPSLAYLRFPLLMASLAFLIGFVILVSSRGVRAFLGAALMMVIFFHAARLAMVAFDPYLSSRPLAEALNQAPPGTLIVNHHYYTYSSVFFYTNRTALLLNGRYNNLEYGAYAPDAPQVFISDADFKNLWFKPERYYFLASPETADRLKALLGGQPFQLVKESGGKLLLTNHPLDGASRSSPVTGNLLPKPSPTTNVGKWGASPGMRRWVKPSRES